MTGISNPARLTVPYGRKPYSSIVVSIKRWTAYGLLTAALVTAVVLKGGVYPQQWVWMALAISAAALLVATIGRRRTQWGVTLMGILLVGMMFQLVPLPPALVAKITPEHWRAVATARTITGQEAGAWVSLTLAPSATFERLLNVVPTMATFVVASEMACWWQDRIWIAVAPVLGVAWFESLLGFVQFHFARVPGTAVAGTYVNRNHFAGLLEIAFPIALALAIAAWRKGAAPEFNHRPGPGLRTAFFLAISCCLLAGVLVSLSRTGFICIVAALGVTMLVIPLSPAAAEDNERLGASHKWRRVWRWGL